MYSLCCVYVSIGGLRWDAIDRQVENAHFVSGMVNSISFFFFFFFHFIYWIPQNILHTTNTHQQGTGKRMWMYGMVYEGDKVALGKKDTKSINTHQYHVVHMEKWQTILMNFSYMISKKKRETKKKQKQKRRTRKYLQNILNCWLDKLLNSLHRYIYENTRVVKEIYVQIKCSIMSIHQFYKSCSSLFGLLEALKVQRSKVITTQQLDINAMHNVQAVKELIQLTVISNAEIIANPHWTEDLT